MCDSDSSTVAHGVVPSPRPRPWQLPCFIEPRPHLQHYLFFLLFTRKAIAADERAYERTVRDRQSFAQQERSEQEAFLRERERQKALHQMFGKKVRYHSLLHPCTPQRWLFFAHEPTTDCLLPFLSRRWSRTLGLVILFELFLLFSLADQDVLLGGFDVIIVPCVAFVAFSEVVLFPAALLVCVL